MATPPKSGMGYKAAEKNPAEAAKRAKAGLPSGNEASAELTPIELQEMQGNDYINEMMKGNATGQAQESVLAQMPLPPEVRWRLLSSNDLQILAGLIYSHATPSEQLTKEMLAVGSVYYNRWEHTMANPKDTAEFGPPNFQGMAFQVNRMMPLYYDPQRSLSFNGAAKFGHDLPSQLDVKSAVNAIKAAEQLMTGVNPFPDDYVYMDISGQAPTDRVDQNSHAQYGRLHFWAMKPDSLVQADAQIEEAGPLASTAAEPLV